MHQQLAQERVMHQCEYTIPTIPHTSAQVSGKAKAPSSSPVSPATIAQTAIVWWLSCILAWRLSLARLLDRLVLRVCSHFRRL